MQEKSKMGPQNVYVLQKCTLQKSTLQKNFCQIFTCKMLGPKNLYVIDKCTYYASTLYPNSIVCIIQQIQLFILQIISGTLLLKIFHYFYIVEYQLKQQQLSQFVEQLQQNYIHDNFYFSSTKQQYTLIQTLFPKIKQSLDTVEFMQYIHNNFIMFIFGAKLTQQHYNQTYLSVVNINDNNFGRSTRISCCQKAVSMRLGIYVNLQKYIQPVKGQLKDPLKSQQHQGKVGIVFQNQKDLVKGYKQEYKQKRSRKV
eukprot:TRINITY_DN8278_c1_g1_i10.p1 TRINITY_DN8278_c1_g1~~TRINITY_DN8278_c1_g1_i10.p1  ORF type:complete len:255 (-),score=2.90 TRINITY_DN8278_c1_g1_i10:117-881(-)